MNVMPTLEGGLRIDAEDARDWNVLRDIAKDATSFRVDLADQLGAFVTDSQVADDWRDFVVPDLRSCFAEATLHVVKAVSEARTVANDGPGPVWITPQDADFWYSALNQARLALEEKFHFGPGETVNPASLPPRRRSAFLRSQFYCAIQSLLLEHVMH